MTTAAWPRALATARSRSVTVSQRGCRTSSNSCSGNCASSACTRRAAVSPVEYVRAARASAAPDLASVARLAETLYAERETPAFEGVYTAYDRAHRLAGRAEQDAAPEVDRGLLREDAERALAEALAGVSVNGDVRAALESGASLAPLLERFFDEVLVMDEDPAVRANRLRLLLDVRDKLGRLGDFSQIPR